MRFHAPTSTVCTAIAILFLAGCGDVTKDPPVDAMDTVGDTVGDTTSDIPDTATDTDTPDTTIDTSADTTTDTSLDEITDPVEDDPTPEPDALDLPDGWPTDNPTDWPYASPPQCRGPGGFCSGGEDILCPWGYQIIEDVDPHRRCEADGWCCVVAPYSECTDSGTANCIWDTDCASVPGGCWSDATPAMDCGVDRVCCVNTCV